MSDDPRTRIARRKDHHLDVVLQQSVGGPAPATGLGGYRLEYDALPDVDLEDVDLSCQFLDRTLSAPLIIGAMTGGTDRAGKINARLARAAARVGVGMALGSQRAMLIDPSVSDTFCVRQHAPDLPLLFGNIGAIQLNYGVDIDAIAEVLKRVDADALNLHLNPLQEAIQPEGDTRFAGLAQQIAQVVPHIPVPTIVKEVGAGISSTTAAKLAALPISGIEVAGVGGTSWAAVESHRCPEGSHPATVGQRLAGFGVPTGRSIQICRQALPDRVVIASGGIRTGLDVAVALALGSDMVALAKPFLEAAESSEDAVVEALELLLLELRIVCFCTGAGNVRALRDVRVIAPGHRYPLATESEPR